jgi:hypothetical protein
MPARVLRVHVPSVLNQQPNDFGVAIAGGVMDWMIASAIREAGKVRMAGEEGGDSICITDKERREKLACQVVNGPHMSIKGACLHEKGDYLFVIRHLARVMQHIPIVRRHVGAGLEEKANDCHMAPEARMENRAPLVLVISVDQRGVIRHPRLDCFEVASRRGFMDG